MSKTWLDMTPGRGKRRRKPRPKRYSKRKPFYGTCRRCERIGTTRLKPHTYTVWCDDRQAIRTYTLLLCAACRGNLSKLGQNVLVSEPAP